MKKLFNLTFALVFGLSLFVSTTLSENYCLSVFSEKEQTSLKIFYSLFVNRKEEFKTKVIGLDKEYFDVVSQKIKDTVDCEGRDYYYSYYDVKSDLKNILNGVFANKYTNFASDAESVKAVESLQNNLYKTLGFGYDLDKAIKSTQDMNLSLDLDLQEEGVKMNGNLNLKTDGDYDMKNSKFDMNMKMDGNFNFVENNSNLSGGFNLDIDVLKAKDMYLKLNDLDFDLQSDEISSAYMIKSVLESVKTQLKGKYINLSSGAEQNQLNLLLNTNQLNTFGFLRQGALMKFYKSTDGNRYGFFDKNICNILKSFSFDGSNGYYDCKNFLNEMVLESKGKGYLILNKNLNTYSVGFTDKWTSEKMTTQERTKLDKILYWNETQITKFYLPLSLGIDKDGHILYENGKLDGKMIDNSVQVYFSGSLSANSKNINLSISMPDESVLMIGNLNYTRNGDVHNISLNLDIKQNGKKIGNIKLTGKEVIQYLSTLNIQDPAGAQSLQEIMESFGGLGF